MTTLQGQSTTGTSSISQVAAAEALGGGPDEALMLDEFRRRRDLVCARWQALPDVSLVVPDGAFYVFPDVTRLLSASVDGEVVGTTTRLCELLLEREQVALVPGEAFGAPGHVRMAYTAGVATLEEGMQAIGRVFAELSGRLARID